MARGARHTFASGPDSVSALVRDGEGPCIVFLHGLCGGAIHFDKAFSDGSLAGLPIVAVDLPGFGESAGVENVTIDTMAGAVRDILAALKQSRVWIAAHSMASSVAARLVDIAGGIVLMEGNLLPVHLEFSDRIKHIGESDFPQEYDRIRRTSAMILKYQTKSVPAEALKSYAATWTQCSDQAVWSVAGEVNSDVRSGAPGRVFQNFGGSVTCLYGTDGTYAGSLGDITALLPCAVTVPIRNSGHFPMIDAPGETYGAIARAISGESAKC